MDISAVRAERLRQLLSEDRGPERGRQARLARRLGTTAAQISQWLLGLRTINERSARAMEERGRLAPRFFDEPAGSAKSLSAVPAHALLVREPPAPFEVVGQLGALLERAPVSARAELAQVLAAFATSGGARDYEARIVTLLTSPPGKQLRPAA